ncbi:hypothetical protein [Cupriavidus taiwanensis]|uniref:hypothetical protein n=1 Tax=Cupriavidus taiwanensis TaxID=164546 RepID=UPI001F11B946|nr:hypothetical protein [Cupriavidus taiwanensis]
MHAALARQYGPTLPALQETSGGIGMQRSQLGAFLDGLTSVFRHRIGQQANGTPLYRGYGWIEAGAIATLLYRAAPALPIAPGSRALRLPGAGRPHRRRRSGRVRTRRAKICPRWVSVRDLHPSTEVLA